MHLRLGLRKIYWDPSSSPTISASREAGRLHQILNLVGHQTIVSGGEGGYEAEKAFKYKNLKTLSQIGNAKKTS